MRNARFDDIREGYRRAPYAIGADQARISIDDSRWTTRVRTSKQRGPGGRGGGVIDDQMCLTRLMNNEMHDVSDTRPDVEDANLECDGPDK